MISPTNESPDRRLRVRWFDAWHPELDKALATLPEMPTCPHELFRMLMQNPIGARKQTALVTEDGRPVAVVGLRRKHRHWEPVPQDPSPRAVAPAAPGFLVPALRALDRDIWVWGFDDF
ncbi:MAG TPA: hypothetical protein VNL92_03155, partial [Dehalococcoidia bacterium]|nr:hypothetical protein [Dehalococcoidia bacterium]